MQERLEAHLEIKENLEAVELLQVREPEGTS
jgi:hypothetical protein